MALWLIRPCRPCWWRNVQVTKRQSIETSMTRILYSFSCKLLWNCGCSLQQLIELYFWRGFKYEVIVKFLKEYHDVELSMRTLRRRLIDYGLRRRNQPSSLMQVWNAVHSELRGPGMNTAITISFCCIIECCIMLILLLNIKKCSMCLCLINRAIIIFYTTANALSFLLKFTQ